MVFRSDDNGTVQRLVATGMGCAIVPALAVDPHDDSTVALELGIPPRRIALAWHRDRYHTHAAQAFVETAREVCTELAATVAPTSACAT